MKEIKPVKCKGCGKEPTITWHAGFSFGNTSGAPHYTLKCECGQMISQYVFKPMVSDRDKARRNLIRRWNKYNETSNDDGTEARDGSN